MDKKITAIDTPIVGAPDKQKVGGMFRIPERFSAISKLVLRDLNNDRTSPRFYLYTKDQISDFLKNPYTNEKNLRNAVIYLYGASSHFRRLIQYFVCLSDLSYVVSPFKIDTSAAKPVTVRRNYHRVLNLMSMMDVKNQFENILTVCLREDTFYGTMRVTADSIIIQQLPSDYCTISVIENNVPNVSFDFSYFSLYPNNLALYPDEFNTKYDIYQQDMAKMKWQELDAPTSFAIKCNKDILNYAMPPFSGILREIYNIEDYKQLKMSKTELENYALLVMTLGMNDNGEWTMDYERAKEFWHNLDNVLPEEVGSVLTPMKIDKISFEKSNTGDTNTIAEAEQNLYTAAGVSSLLFNNEKASAGSLQLSVKADQSLTYSIVKSMECMINRFIHSYTFGRNFRVTFLDCSPYNRKEIGEAYLKACQFGMPMVSYYCASQGLMQEEIDCMNFLEDDVLGIKGRFIPLRSSSTMTSSGKNDGRPVKEATDLTDEGERSRESEDGENPTA